MNTVTLPSDIAQPAPHFKSPTAWMLYVYLLGRADENGNCILGRRSAATALMTSQNAVRRAVDNLCANGWITLGNPNLSDRRPWQEALPGTHVTICDFKTYSEKNLGRTTPQGHAVGTKKQPNTPISNNVRPSKQQKLFSSECPKSNNKSIRELVFSESTSEILSPGRREIEKGSGEWKERGGQSISLHPKDAIKGTHKTHLTPYFDLWIDAYGGRPAGGQLAAAIKSLRDHFSETEILERWKHYLEENDAQFASPSRFAATFLSWGPKRPTLKSNNWITEEQLANGTTDQERHNQTVGLSVS